MQPIQADTLDDAIAESTARAPSPIVARAAMIERRAIDSVRLSPDGQSLAYVIEQGRRRALWLFDTISQDHSLLLTSKLLDDIYWSADSQYIFVTSAQGVSAVPVDAGKAPGFVINLDRDRDEVFYRVDRQHPHAFFVAKQSEEGQQSILYRVSADGTRTQLHKSAQRPVNFLMGSDGSVSILLELHEGMMEVLHLQGDSSQTITSCSGNDGCALYGFDAQSGTLYMKGRFETDHASLYALNLNSGETSLVHTDPSGRFDLASVMIDPLTAKPDVAFYRDEHITHGGLTANTSDILARLKPRLKAEYVELEASEDRETWLAFDVGPGRKTARVGIYRAGSDDVLLPMETAPYAQRQAASDTDFKPALRVPVWYPVSDGGQQLGYVTLPNGLAPREVPLVVVPHGGPWSRSIGSYNSVAQFLANRGYAVFEPNFRASTGFGRQFTLSANRDFGNGRVHQDILDGMQYVLSRGVGDPGKLGISGHSFGGFSVLGALAFTPDLFQVGFAGAPPANLVDAIRFAKNAEQGPEWQVRYANFIRLVVDPNDPQDALRLTKQSPAEAMQNIKRPLYIWAGEKDKRVSILDVRDYALKLHQANKQVTFLVEPSAPHSPRKALHREAYFYMLEKALADHLGGRMDADISPQLARYLRKSLVFDKNSICGDREQQRQCGS